MSSEYLVHLGNLGNLGSHRILDAVEVLVRIDTACPAEEEEALVGVEQVQVEEVVVLDVSRVDLQRQQRQHYETIDCLLLEPVGQRAEEKTRFADQSTTRDNSSPF